jgi:hypothetical protein
MRECAPNARRRAHTREACTCTNERRALARLIQATVRDYRQLIILYAYSTEASHMTLQSFQCQEGV